MKPLEKEIVSPVTGNTEAELESTIDAQYLVDTYQEKFDIDIEEIFKKCKTVSIYRCMKTGYRFYHPLNLMGDDKFYGHFGKYDWYYLAWKWEHQQCLKYINDGYEVLEVGAAKGDFLLKLQQLKDVECTGLELNSDAVIKGNELGVNLQNETIEEHAKEHVEKYDVVCSFQVLEHLSNVKEVIEAMIICLKPGGKLIISVPNNESFIGDNPLPSRVLNMPPHHMGLWDSNSLKNLERIFSITHLENIIEPLEAIHSDNYQYTKVYKALFRQKLLLRIFWKLRIHLFVRPILKMFSKRLMGHSIISIYTKR